MRRTGDDISDHDLVTRVRSGDDAAFEQLYRRYHRRIASYIQGMVHDHARAEDIAQDVFMSALRRMRETDRPIAFKPWVYEIAKTACIDQIRRSKRAEEVSMDADEGLGSADYGRLVSATPTPDVAVDHKQQLDHLCGAFGGLSETHHEILVMRELEGLSYREIGERLGMTRPAVESTLFRARRRLTEEYEDLVTGERCVRVQAIIATASEGSLGVRDRRRLARHVSYCQPCLRHARLSGIDARDLVHKPVRAKIAAFLPLPFLKKWWGAEDASASTPDAPSATLVQWSAQLSTVDPGMVSSWGKAAATAATVAIAGLGAGVATKSASDDVRAALPGGAAIERLSDIGNGDSGPVRASSDGGSGSGKAAGSQAKRERASARERREARGGADRTTASRTTAGTGSQSGATAGGGDSGGSGDGGTTTASGTVGGEPADGGAGGRLGEALRPATGGGTSTPQGGTPDSGSGGGEQIELPKLDGGTTSAPADAPSVSTEIGKSVENIGRDVAGAVGGG